MFKNISVNVINEESKQAVYWNIIKTFFIFFIVRNVVVLHLTILPVATCVACFGYLEEEECV